eukprot:1142770-Pelagomonas_calceolata.AAC.1
MEAMFLLSDIRAFCPTTESGQLIVRIKRRHWLGSQDGHGGSSLQPAMLSCLRKGLYSCICLRGQLCCSEIKGACN